MRYDDYLAHFNPNHDPRNGQFTKGHGVVGALQKIGYHQAHSKAGQLGLKMGQKRLKKQTLAKGAREDNTAYKYNKAGESGWKGLGRAAKANVKSRRGRSVLTIAGATGAGFAIAGAVDLARRRKALKWLDNSNFSIPMSSRAVEIAKLSGKRALQAGLVIYGAIKWHDIINKSRTKKDNAKLQKQMANESFDIQRRMHDQAVRAHQQMSM